ISPCRFAPLASVSVKLGKVIGVTLRNPLVAISLAKRTQHPADLRRQDTQLIEQFKAALRDHLKGAVAALLKVQSAPRRLARERVHDLEAKTNVK
ncbi:hypothetical protein ACNQ08_27440, partial [Enterobacter cloacae complex sp.6730661]|uniref:hypothetical protein n=1 Tax=Enterobacter cloacae complex sp.6730661 TaxID=3397169 RepID=UPI003AAD280C